MKLPEIYHVEEIAERMDEAAKWLPGLNGDPYLREAVMRAAVREFAWAINGEFGMPYGLAGPLGTMGEVPQQETTKAK